MCWTRIKAGLVISAFIYSDAVPVFFTSICCLVLRLARTPLHNGSKLQGRAILESGSFLHHMKTLSQHARGVHHRSTKGNMVLQRVWEGETKEAQQLCQGKKNFFLERWLWLISNIHQYSSDSFFTHSILVRDIGVDHWQTEAAHWYSSVI